LSVSSGNLISEPEVAFPITARGVEKLKESKLKFPAPSVFKNKCFDFF
jgi:hypothetical protein